MIIAFGKKEKPRQALREELQKKNPRRLARLISGTYENRD